MQDNRFNPSRTPFTGIVSPTVLNAPVDEGKLTPSESEISLGTGQIPESNSPADYTSAAMLVIDVHQSVETEEGESDRDSEGEGAKDSDEQEGVVDSEVEEAGDSEREAEGTKDAEKALPLAKKPQQFLGVTRILGHMRFEKVLGSGAFGEVYQGQWGDRKVALKKIDMNHAKKHLDGLLNEADILESLEWEVSRLSTVNHPNCVQFYGIYEHPQEKQIYLVMEFCEGGTLESALKKKNPTWEMRWQWALEMSQGLSYLHHEGVLHRDLKAENILLDQAGCAKLADLGVAQVDALLADKDIKAVEQGLQDSRFISPEKSLASYNQAMAEGTPEGQHRRIIVWLGAEEKFPSASEQDEDVIYLKEMSKTRIGACWWVAGVKKTAFTVNNKQREEIVSRFAGREFIEALEDEDRVAELCGYRAMPLSDTPAMDIYALGFVFWQMVSGGKKPRCYGNPVDDMPQKEWIGWMFGSFPSNYEREPIPADCPPEWRQLILDCWQHDPEKRPTAQELVKRLEGFIQKFHEQPVILQTCERLEALIHPKRLEALSYFAPYLTADRVDEPIETYWQRFEGSMNPVSPTPTTTATTTSTGTMTTTVTMTALTQEGKSNLKNNSPLELEKTLNDFLAKPGHGALLLLGEAGLGKTLTTYRLADSQVQAWRSYLNTPKESRGTAPYLPIFIRPTLKHWTHRALTDAFTKAKEKYGLEQTPMPLRFLVIVDGYDECQLDMEPQNLCAQLGIAVQASGNTPVIKILVTCRPNTVPELQLKERFGLAQSNRKELEVRYFLPFNFDQIVTYLKDRLGWDEPTKAFYTAKLNQTEKLRTVLRNPFVLQLFVQSWETLVTSSSGEKVFENLNRSKIYVGFIAHWLRTQQGLLDEAVQKVLAGNTPDESADIAALIESFERFGSEVAFAAFQNKEIMLDSKIVRQLASPWGHLKSEVKNRSEARFKAREARLTSSTKRRELLTQSDFTHIMLSRLIQFQAGSPLKEKTFGYEFSHKSFFEYFVAQRILELATRDPASAVKAGLQLLNSRPIQEEPEVLDFFVEGWRTETATLLVPAFFEMITASRRDPKVAQASANAATILNVCRVSFGRKDLSGVHLPGADLSRVLLDNTVFMAPIYKM